MHSFVRPLNTQCMDEHLNLILQHAVERRTVKTTEGAAGAEGCVCDDSGMCMCVYCMIPRSVRLSPSILHTKQKRQQPPPTTTQGRGGAAADDEPAADAAIGAGHVSGGACGESGGEGTGPFGDSVRWIEGGDGNGMWWGVCTYI